MNQTIQMLIQSIGNEILDITGDAAKKVLSYAEVEDGTVSVSVFYSLGKGNTPVFRYADASLSKSFYSLWIEWGEEHDEFWRALSYTITNGNVNLKVIYEDKFDEEMKEFERRELLVKEYFGSGEVDYT